MTVTDARMVPAASSTSMPRRSIRRPIFTCSAIRCRVRDLEGLQGLAGRAYGLAEREYARLIGTDFRVHNRKFTPDTIPELFVGRDFPEDEG